MPDTSDVYRLRKPGGSPLGCFHVKFAASVPFERFPELKRMIEQRDRWRIIDWQWAYFETQWKPKSWDASYGFLFIRKKGRFVGTSPMGFDHHVSSILRQMKADRV